MQTTLPSLSCLRCDNLIAPSGSFSKIPVARRYEHCIRRCEPCGVGASNAKTAGAQTWIFREPLDNSPTEIRDGAKTALRGALNQRNRQTKKLGSVFRLQRMRSPGWCLLI